MKKFTLFLAILLTSIGILWAQNRVVSGTVISADDQSPVIGASIFIKGNTKVGALTDVNGKFKFTAPVSAKFIVISYIGMKTIEQPIANNMKIVLHPNAQELDEIVVVGYGSGKSIANTTASVVKVGAKMLEEKPIANPFDAIQGKVSGLQIYSSSGEPGAVSSVRLHGRGSLGAGSSPLYVLDGVPVSSGAIQSMNPNDFESMQILKDAGATSIYGARAANGVIYITTKKGRSAEKASIVVRAQYGVSSLANADYFKSVMTSDELADFWITTGIKTKDYVDALRKEYPNDTRWYKYFYKNNAPTYSADMAISGGSGKTNYYISGSAFYSEGLRARSEYERYTFRANLNTSLNKYIKVSLNNSITYDKSMSNFGKGNSFTGGLGPQILPFYSPYDAEGKEYYDEKIPGINIYSPEYIADKIPNPNKSLLLNTMANATITPVKNLTLSSTVGLNLSDNTNSWLRKPSYAEAFGDGSSSQEFARYANWIFTNTAEYKLKINDLHNVAMLLGHEYTDNNYNAFSAKGSGLTDDRMVLLSATTKDKDVSEGFSQSAFLSFFGKLSYDFNRRYFVDLTLRNDASSRFGKNKRNGLFWSASGMWKMKEESFLKDIEWLNRATVRLSTGTSGNSAIDNYSALALVKQIDQYATSPAWGISSPGNNILTWENQMKTTLGFDFRIADRIGLNLEFYNRVTTDMLMDVPYPYTSGFSSMDRNVGKYSNKGIDIRVDLDILDNKKEGYFVSTYFTYNYNKDKVLKLFQGLDKWIIPGTGVCYKVGMPVTFFYPLFKEIDPATGVAQWYLPGEDNAVKTTDDSKITTVFNSSLEQNTGIKRYAPVNGGWGLSAGYKGLYMQADFAFSYGKHMIANDAFFYENPIIRQHVAPRRTVWDYWKEPGQHAKYPKIAPNMRFTEFDSRLIQNASFMRMKNITLGYVVPQKLLSKQNLIHGVKIYFTGRNLLTFTKYDGPDPEVDANLSLGANPNTKQISFGVEFKF